MLKYVPEALAQFRHKAPQTPQHQPYPHVRPTYGATRQYAEAQETSEQLSKEEKSYVQEVIGSFLYYTRCVGASMLPALGTLATQQASPTKNTMKKIKQFLGYAATHPDAVVTYHASTWSWQDTATNRTSLNAMHKAGQEGICSCQTIQRHLPTMERCSQYCK